jgi:hypothetical protein
MIKILACGFGLSRGPGNNNSAECGTTRAFFELTNSLSDQSEWMRQRNGLLNMAIVTDIVNMPSQIWSIHKILSTSIFASCN